MEESLNLEDIDFSAYDKIVTNSSVSIDVENKTIELIETDKKEDIKEVAYELLNKYRQKEFENDGRMLEFFENNIDLVALGSIADIVPLTNENRILVKYGLSVLNKDYSKRFGLGFIFNEYLKEKKISAIFKRTQKTIKFFQKRK